MLDSLFIKVLDMTLAGSAVIVIVILARLMLKKAPKVFSYALWAVVLWRLLCPVELTASVGVLPQRESVGESYSLAREEISFADATYAAQQAVGDAINGGLGVQHIPTTEKTQAGSTVYATSRWWEVWILFGKYVYAAGLAIMLLISGVSLFRLRRSLTGTVRLRENIYLADRAPSPFVLGIFRPRIYLPSDIGEKERDFILLHEKHHIHRGDHVWKLLAFAALCIHWFNPLVWLAFSLAGKDMEMSCDEAVLKKSGQDIRADYAQTLLRLAAPRRIAHAMPLAFGEGDTKGRVKNMLKWKKAKPLALILATVLCLGVFAACALDRQVPAEDEMEECYFLIHREGVLEVSVRLKNRGGGVVHADGSSFEVGEKVYLGQIRELMDLQGAEITALDESGEAVYRIAWPDHATAEEILALAEESDWMFIPEDFPVSTENEADAPVSAALPITAAYSTAERQYDHVYETDETEYVTYMDISIHENIKDVSFGLLNWDGADLYMEKTLYTAPIMEEHDVFLAAVVFYGDMTTYGITFTDEAGEERSFTFVVSGMDGSLECLETERILPAAEES